MTVEELGKIIIEEAQEQIKLAYSYNSDEGLTWSQTDALGDIRSDLRFCLVNLSCYIEDLPEKEAIEWLGNRVGWENNIVCNLID